jgi:hypothetical protein
VARWLTHRARHSVDTPVLTPKDACAFLRHDSSPDPSSLGLGPSPGRVALRRNSTRNWRNGSYASRRSIPEDNGGSEGDSDSLVPIPLPCAVLGSTAALRCRARSIPHPSPSPQVDPLERAGSAPSVLALGLASSPSVIPRGRFLSEVAGSSSRRRPRSKSFDEFGAKPGARGSRACPTSASSGKHKRSDGWDATEGNVSRQTPVVRDEGKAQTHFVSGLLFEAGWY